MKGFRLVTVEWEDGRVAGRVTIDLFKVTHIVGSDRNFTAYLEGTQPVEFRNDGTRATAITYGEFLRAWMLAMNEGTTPT